MKISEILKMYPETLAVFRSFDMKCAEDDSCADKTLEENLSVEQVDFIDVLSRLDKIVHKQKQETGSDKNPNKRLKPLNDYSNYWTKHAICEFCCRECDPVSLNTMEILLANIHNNTPNFSKLILHGCKTCLKGGWKYRLMKVFLILVSVFLGFALIPTAMSFGRLAGGIIIAMPIILTMFILHGPMQKMPGSPVKIQEMDFYKNLLQGGYTVVYVWLSGLETLKGDIIITSDGSFLYTTGINYFSRKIYTYSGGFKERLRGISVQAIWKIPLENAFKNAYNLGKNSKYLYHG